MRYTLVISCRSFAVVGLTVLTGCSGGSDSTKPAGKENQAGVSTAPATALATDTISAGKENQDFIDFSKFVGRQSKRSVSSELSDLAWTYGGGSVSLGPEDLNLRLGIEPTSKWKVRFFAQGKIGQLECKVPFLEFSRENYSFAYIPLHAEFSRHLTENVTLTPEGFELGKDFRIGPGLFVEFHVRVPHPTNKMPSYDKKIPLYLTHLSTDTKAGKFNFTPSVAGAWPSSRFFLEPQPQTGLLSDPLLQAEDSDAKRSLKYLKGIIQQGKLKYQPQGGTDVKSNSN